MACAALLAATGWLIMSQTENPWLFYAGLTVALAGMKSVLPTFWAIPSSFLSGAAAAGGVALINSVANIGGLLAPIVAGNVKTMTGSFSSMFLPLAMVMVAGGLLVLQARAESERQA